MSPKTTVMVPDIGSEAQPGRILAQISAVQDARKLKQPDVTFACVACAVLWSFPAGDASQAVHRLL